MKLLKGNNREVCCMALFFSCLMVGLVVIAVWKRNYKKETIDNILSEGNKKEWLWFLFPMGLWIYDLLSKKQPAQNEEEREWANALYVREDAKKKLQLQGARQMVNFWICLFFASVLGISVSFLPDTQIQKTELERPEFGQTKDYSLTVEGLEEGDQTIHVSVDGKEPETQGMMAVFDDAFDSVKEQILGENESLENVQTNLSLVSSTIYGIRVAWKSLTPELLDDFGVIQIQDIPPEGVTAQLQVKLSYSMYEQYYTLDVRLMMPKKDAQYYMMLLTKQLKDENNNTKTKSIVTLPENIEGKKLTYKTVQTQPIRLMPALFLILPFVLYEIARQKRKEAFENRNKQLIADYPNFVFELGLMIQCGLNVRTAWNRLTAEYEETQHKCKGYQRYLFEEMLVTRNQIEAGVNEAAAYGAFGRRCRAHCYLKLGSSLEQNLRQGISGLEQQLDQELTQALEQRKNQAIQDGERMETKMLFPMFLLLGLVMAIVMIPAFMSM